MRFPFSQKIYRTTTSVPLQCIARCRGFSFCIVFAARWRDKGYVTGLLLRGGFLVGGKDLIK